MEVIQGLFGFVLFIFAVYIYVVLNLHEGQEKQSRDNSSKETQGSSILSFLAEYQYHDNSYYEAPCNSDKEKDMKKETDNGSCSGDGGD